MNFRIETITEAGEEGDCCIPGEKRGIKIETCVPTISGVICLGDKDTHTFTECDDLKFNCLGFETGHFCIESGDCGVQVNSRGLYVYGHPTGQCGPCDDGESPKQYWSNIHGIRLGKGLCIESGNSKDGLCCGGIEEDGQLTISAIVPQISGMTGRAGSAAGFDYETAYDQGTTVTYNGGCYEANQFVNGQSPADSPEAWDEVCCTEGGSQLLCTGYECLGFDDSFSLSYDHETCSALVSTTRARVSGWTGTLSTGDCYLDTPSLTEMGCAPYECIGFDDSFAMTYDAEACTATLSVVPQKISISGLTCLSSDPENSVLTTCADKFAPDCLGFNTGDFCISTGKSDDGTCTAQINALGFLVSGAKTGDCGCSEEEQLFYGNVRFLKLGAGLCIDDNLSASGNCCDDAYTQESLGYVTINATPPKISGWYPDPSLGPQRPECCHPRSYYKALECTGYECLAFDSGFLVDFDEETCVATVSKCGGKISGASNYPTVFPDTEDFHFFDEGCCGLSDDPAHSVDCMPFNCLVFDDAEGWRLQVDEDCNVKVNYPCTTISGAGCPITQYGLYECTGVDCLQFHTGDFTIKIDDDCNALICARSNPFAVSGFKEGDCCGNDDLTDFPHVSRFVYGSGFTLKGLGGRESEECCDNESGIALQIDVCTPMISGWTGTVEGCCEATKGPMGCRTYECLGFDDTFVLEYDEEECRATVSAVCATKISGWTGEVYGCCEEKKGPMACTGFECIGFDDSFTLHHDPDNCTTTVSAVCSNRISGWTGAGHGCCSTEPIMPMPCTGYECLGFDESFVLYHDHENCTTRVSACSNKLAGYREDPLGFCCQPPLESDKLECTGYKCLEFDESFRIEYDDEACTAIVKGCQPKISGYTGDCCPTVHETGPRGSIECTGYQCIGFGEDFSLTYDSNTCTTLVNACMPRISGMECGTTPLDNCGRDTSESLSVDCERVLCTVYDTGDFFVNYDDDDCTAKVSSVGHQYKINLQRKKQDGDATHPCYQSDMTGCLPPAESDTWFSNVKGINFKEGFYGCETFFDDGRGGCEGGCGLEISTVVPRISGNTCARINEFDQWELDNTSCDRWVYDCLGFHTGQFFLSTGNGGGLCKAQVHSRGFKITGSNTGDSCKGCGEEDIGFELLGEIRLGEGLCIEGGNSTDGYEGECANGEWGHVTLRGTPLPRLSGWFCDADSSTYGDRYLDCEDDIQYKCLGFNTDHFCIESGQDYDCSFKVSSMGFRGYGTNTGSCGCEDVYDNVIVNNVHTLQAGPGICIASGLSTDGWCCDDDGEPYGDGTLVLTSLTPHVSGLVCASEDSSSYPGFDEGTTYNAGNKISFNGSCYESKLNGVEANPDNSPFDWNQIPCLSSPSCAEVECFNFNTGDFYTNFNAADCVVDIGHRSFLTVSGYEADCCGAFDHSEGGEAGIWKDPDVSVPRVENITFGSGLKIRTILRDEEGCTGSSIEVGACIPTFSGANLDNETYASNSVTDAPICDYMDCLAFAPEDFGMDWNSSECSSTVYSAGMTVSGLVTTDFCLDHPYGPFGYPLSATREKKEHLSHIRLGSGLYISEYEDAYDKSQKGWVTIDTVIPTVSGTDCTGKDWTCMVFNCLGFDPEDFALEYSTDNCMGVVQQRSFLTISGIEGGCCRDSSSSLWSQSNGGEAGYWKAPDASYSRVENIVFGSGLAVNPIFIDENGCTGTSLQVTACNTKFSAANLDNETYESNGSTDAPICDFLDCLAFAPEDFGMDWDVTIDGCEGTLYSAGMTVSGAELADGTRCWRQPTHDDKHEHIGNIILGDGLYVQDYNDGSDKANKGDITIAALGTRISGADCDGGDIACTGLSCLQFDTDDFALEIDSYTCNATIYGDGISVSGLVTTGYCADKGNSKEEKTHLEEIRLGDSLYISDYSDGTVCEKGWVQIDTLLPKVSGIACTDSYPIQSPNCSEVSCFTFNTGDFYTDYNQDTCEVEIGAIGITYEGFSDCDKEYDVTAQCLTGIRTKDGLIATDYSTSDKCCEGKGFVELSTATSLISSINGCDTSQGGSLDPCYTLSIKATLCGSPLSSVTTCSSDEIEVDIQITKADIEACLDTCCINYKDSDGNPASIEVFVPECASDCYGCCE